MREEAVFGGVIDAEVAREAEDGLLREDLDLRLGQRGLPAIGDTVVEGAEGDRVASVHLEPQLVEVLANASRLARHLCLDLLVDAARLGGLDLGLLAQLEMVEGERRSSLHPFIPADSALKVTHSRSRLQS